MIAKPGFPYEWTLYDEGGLYIIYSADDKSEWLDEDEYIQLSDDVNDLVCEARSLVDTEDFDIYEWLDKHLEELNPGLERKYYSGY